MLTERDKIHLQKLIQKYDKSKFQQLRPPPEIYQLTIPQSLHFTDTDKKKRFIYYRVPYLPHEQAHITEVKMKMIDANIFENYSEEIILKHLYASDMNVEKCLDRLRKLQAFQNNQTVTSLSPMTIQLLQTGCIYTYGHDRNMKPIVILRSDMFDYSKPIHENYNPVYFLMLVVLGFRTVPFYAEKYVCIFDLCNINFTEIPFKYLYEVFSCMNMYYCGNVEKTYVFNAKGIGSLWTFAKTFISESARKKIVFINQKNTDEILTQIDPLQLQKKYGGKLQNLKEYWPPKCTNEEFDAILMHKKENEDAMTNSEFYSVCNDVEYFTEKSEGICGSANCQCNVF